MLPPPLQVRVASQEKFIGNVPKPFGRKFPFWIQAVIAAVVTSISDVANLSASPCVMGGGGMNGGSGLAGPPVHAVMTRTRSARMPVVTFRINSRSLPGGLTVDDVADASIVVLA